MQNQLDDLHSLVQLQYQQALYQVLVVPSALQLVQHLLVVGVPPARRHRFIFFLLAFPIKIFQKAAISFEQAARDVVEAVCQGEELLWIGDEWVARVELLRVRFVEPLGHEAEMVVFHFETFLKYFAELVDGLLVGFYELVDVALALEERFVGLGEVGRGELLLGVEERQLAVGVGDAFSILFQCSFHVGDVVVQFIHL